MKSGSVHVNTVQAKNELNSLVEKTRQSKNPVIIEKRGEPVAVLWGYEEYQNSMTTDVSESADLSIMCELRSFHQLQKKQCHEAGEDSVEILRQLRAERSTS